MWTTVLTFVCLLGIPVLFVGLILLTVAVAMWEQRVVWYFVPVEDAHRKPAPLDRANPYAVPANLTPIPPPSVESSSASAAARDLGFKFLGTHRDAKGDRYRVRYDFWIAPQRDVLVNVGCGTVMGIAVDARWLYTRLQDGRLVVTITDQSASEYDLAGQRIEAVVSTLTFEQLLAAHRLRVSQQFSPVQPYGPDPLKDHRASVTQRVLSLVGSGYAKHLDPGQEKWSYTLWGALLFAPLANGQALRRSIISDASLNR